MKLRLSSSKVSGADCLYKLYLEEVLGITSGKKSSALVHGSAWHIIMEAFYSHVRDNGWEDVSGAVYASMAAAKEYWEQMRALYDLWEDYRNLDTEAEMLLSYIGTYSGSDEGFLEVVELEKKFEVKVPVDVSAEHCEVEEITYSGVIDMECKLYGEPWLIDHKTTGKNPKLEAEKLGRSLQFIGYSYGKKELGLEANGFIANFAACSCRKKKDGTWGKKNINFYRSPQVYSEQHYCDFIERVNQVAAAIALCYISGNWPKNYSCCFNYGRCRMYAQCQSGCTEPIDGYILNPERGSELTYE